MALQIEAGFPQKRLCGANSRRRWHELYRFHAGKVAPNNTADVSLFLGQQLADAGAVRDSYKAATSALDASDRAGRTAAKIAAREATPTLVAGVIQGVRPGTGPVAGSGGRANVTSAAADGLGQTMKIGGRVLVVGGVVYDVVRISTSDDPGRTTFQAVFGWGGATLGGVGGAAAGTFVGPGPGTVAGGVGGAVGGSIVGEKVGGAVYDGMKYIPPGYFDTGW